MEGKESRVPDQHIAGGTQQPTALELTLRFMDAHNRRDRTAMRAMLPPALEYVRPGGGRLRTADEVMEQYERDWTLMERSRASIREYLASDSEIRAEITIEATINGRSGAVEGAVTQRWSEGKLVRYRLYTDPVPAEVAAAQPPDGPDS
jgi:SnoaL-like domain